MKARILSLLVVLLSSLTLISAGCRPRSLEPEEASPPPGVETLASSEEAAYSGLACQSAITERQMKREVVRYQIAA